MDSKSNSINWFEIPVTNIDRAMKFYQSILEIEMQLQDFGGFKMAFFPFENKSGKLSGSLCWGDAYVPSREGTLVYLNCDPDLQTVLDKVLSEGGEILKGKTHISPESGYMAVIIDSEGNKIALHSNN